MRGIHLALLGTGVVAVGVAGAVLAFSDPHPHDRHDPHGPDAQAAPTPVSTPTLHPLIPLVPIPEPEPGPHRRHIAATPFATPRVALAPVSGHRALAEHAVTVTAVRTGPRTEQRTDQRTEQPAGDRRRARRSTSGATPGPRPVGPHRPSPPVEHDGPSASSPDHHRTQRWARPLPEPWPHDQPAHRDRPRHSEESRSGSDGGTHHGVRRHHDPRHDDPRQDLRHAGPAMAPALTRDPVDARPRSVQSRPAWP